jgi:hypothetical protein
MPMPSSQIQSSKWIFSSGIVCRISVAIARRFRASS